jgi:hypothetical protein
VERFCDINHFAARVTLTGGWQSFREGVAVAIQEISTTSKLTFSNRPAVTGIAC